LIGHNSATAFEAAFKSSNRYGTSIMGTERAVHVQDFIDEHKLGRFQIGVLALCALVVFVDGFDTQAIGYVAPALIRALHVARTALGPVFSAGLFGLMVGSLSFGPLADRVGRRPVLLFCTCWFGILSLATATASSLSVLLVLRFFTGLGLGGAMPNAVALTAEFTPSRVRATCVMVMFCGFSLGAALGGVAAAGLIAALGWRSVFVLGGVLPLLALIPLAMSLPESIRYLVLKNGQSQELTRIVTKIDGNSRRGGRIRFAREPTTDGFQVKQLFTQGRALLTLLLWIVFFMSLLDLYFVTNWLPTVISDSGVSLNRAVLVTSMYQVGGTLGTITLGRLFDRKAPFRWLAVTYLVAAVFVLYIGRVTGSAAQLFAIVFGAGFCVVGGQIGANALAAESYPTRIRATGVGWSLGVGRVGSIVGPAIGGTLLSLQWQNRALFGVAAIPLLIAATAAIFVDRLRLPQGDAGDA
jgi:AAHS family 4-hydroxybenzoate transporter-like MFS transporter